MRLQSVQIPKDLKKVVRATLPALFLALVADAPAGFAQVVRTGAGADAASIQATVNTFRSDVGDPNNGNTPGSFPSGRREVNWDGGGAAAPSTLFPSVMTTFNSGVTTRGAVFTTPGTGFSISGQPSPRFGDINPTYADSFKAFSEPRIFAPLGSNLLDVLFFVPGTNVSALVNGFGAVFTDVDLANTTSLEFFDGSDVSLDRYYAPTWDNGLSFVGVSFGDAIVSRVRITSGNTALGPNDGNGIDVVAMDDFLYGEPQAIPEPGTMALAVIGVLPLLGAITRRRRFAS